MQRELRIIVFDKNELSSELLSIYLKELYEVKDLKVFSDFVAGYEACKHTAPSFAIVDTSENSEFAFDIITKLTQASIPVVATSTSSSSNTIIKLLRAGATEFVSKPVIKQDLHVAINKVLSPTMSFGEKQESKIITMFSGKGGSGKTTIAANLALELAKQTGRKTVLVDLNFTLGELSEFLNLKPVFNLNNLLENIDNISSEQILEIASKYNDTELYLLSEPTNGQNFSVSTFSRVSRFLKLLKETFAYIIIDTPTFADEKIFKTLELSDFILFVSAVNMNAMKNTKKCIELLKEKNINKDKIKIILNRFVENNEHTIEEIETELGHKVYKRIPNNYFTVMTAINKRISVSEENINSNVAESFRELAIMLSDHIINSSLKSLRDDYEH